MNTIVVCVWLCLRVCVCECVEWVQKQRKIITKIKIVKRRIFERRENWLNCEKTSEKKQFE